jgi:hypothetical protein
MIECAVLAFTIAPGDSYTGKMKMFGWRITVRLPEHQEEQVQLASQRIWHSKHGGWQNQQPSEIQSAAPYRGRQERRQL